MSFTAATRFHNRLHGLEHFSEAQHLGMQVHRHLRSQRGSLNKQRFEQAYFRSWVIRFCQEYCESQLEEIDLRWPLDSLIERVSC